MSAFNLTTLGPDQYPFWNETVLQSSQATLFHTTYFFEAVQSQTDIVMVNKGNQPVLGFISGYDKGETTRPPFVPYIGLVNLVAKAKPSGYYSDIRNAHALLIDYLQHKYTKVSVRLSPMITDIQSFVWAKFDTRIRYTYILTIKNLDSVFANFDSNVKRQIKKLNQQKLIISLGEDVCRHVSLFKGTRSDAGNFMDVMFKYQSGLSLLNRCNTIAIKDGDKVLASIFIVWDNYRCYYLLGGYDESNESSRSFTVLALWHAIKFTYEKLGLKEFDFEGSMIPGVENFFRKFGGAKVPYYHIIWRKKSNVRHLLQSTLNKILHGTS